MMQLPKLDLPEPDISVEHWMRGRGVDARVIELADVCYANDFGTSLAQLGLTEAILEARSWDAGEKYLIKDRSFSHLVCWLAHGLQTRVAWPVERIEWHAGDGARIHGPGGQARTILSCSCHAGLCRAGTCERVCVHH